MQNRCVKTLLTSAIALALTAQATDLNIDAYAANQATTLPAVGSYDGFIVYLKEEVGTMSIQSAQQDFDDANIERQLATGGFVVTSAEDLGIFAYSAAGEDYQAKKDAELFEKLRNHPKVALVEPNLRMEITAAPNDSEYDRLWGLNSAQYGINVEGAWDQYRGDGVTVAVVDTGIVNHSDLNGNVVAGYDFISDTFVSNDGDGRDSNPADTGDFIRRGECNKPRDIPSSWHGSHVAGTIAGIANNGRGVSGVAPEANILPVRVLGKCGGSTADIVDGIVWASGGRVNNVPTNNHPAKVINMSLGGASRTCPYSYQRAINAAVNNGATVVVAAGNSNADTSGFTPANCNNIITVAALGATGNRASYSNYGADIDVAAPGGDQRNGGRRNGIYSTVDRGTTRPIGEGYTYMDGTSMASPHVAGVAALLVGKESDLTPAQVKQRIIDGARPIPGTCTLGCGEGIVDVGRTLDIDSDPVDPPLSNELKNGKSVAIASLSRGATKEFTVTLPAGATDFSVKTSGGSGDVDLYVQHSSSSVAECKGEHYGNSESCSLTSPKLGKYKITVKAYSSSTNINIVASWKAGSTTPDDPTPPSDGTISKYIFSGEALASDAFQVSSGTIRATLKSSSSYANLDLILQKQSVFGGWSDVAKSTKPAGQTESVAYRVYVQGSYRFVVKSVYGSALATLNYDLP